MPAIDNQNVDAYAAAIGKLKLIPQIQKQFDTTPKGTLFATIPAGGEMVPAGGTVTLPWQYGYTLNGAAVRSRTESIGETRVRAPLGERARRPHPVLDADTLSTHS